MALSLSKLERLGLRARLIAMVVGVVMLVVGLISAYFIVQHRKALERTAARQAHDLEDDITRDGVQLSRHLALVAQRIVQTMDPLLGDELVRGLAANQDEVLYAVIVDDARHIVAHSDSKLDGQTIDTAAGGNDIVTRYTTRGGARVLEVAAPIIIGEKHWGSAIIGAPLARLDNAIASNDADIRRETSHDLFMTVWIALTLMVIASFAGAYLSNRISRPLVGMLDSVRRIRAGNMCERVDARGGSTEFVVLAEAFNGMVAEVRTHMQDLEKALGEAREASRLKSEFLANVSHELRTPLNAIVNVPTQLLKDFTDVATWHCRACEKVSEEPVCAQCQSNTAIERAQVMRFSGDAVAHKHFLGRLRGQAQHLLSVVNDLLDFSKLDAHMMQLQVGNFDVAHVVESTRESLLGLAADKNLRLIVDVAEAPRTCVGDEVRVAQVLINLIGNAIKFTPEGGEVRVIATKARRDNRSQARFAVIDTGIGIAPEHIGGVFESFRQVDGSQTRAHGGTGLGLAIAKQLIEMHGGQIGVESAVGIGSTFWFEIPVRGNRAGPDPLTAVEVTPVASRKARTKPMVMVIDDNEIHLEIARMILDKEGFETVTLLDARVAFDRIRDDQPDIVILDVMMPEVSGITVLQQLKAATETKQIPVFIASAYSSNRDVVERLGGLWLPKPWDGERLPSVLRTALEQRDETRAA